MCRYKVWSGARSRRYPLLAYLNDFCSGAPLWWFIRPSRALCNLIVQHTSRWTIKMTDYLGQQLSTNAFFVVYNVVPLSRIWYYSNKQLLSSVKCGNPRGRRIIATDCWQRICKSLRLLILSRFGAQWKPVLASSFENARVYVRNKWKGTTAAPKATTVAC